jgi:hypothetical protein
VTDPPYYDNVSYSNLADFFYVWLKRVLGNMHPDHFSTPLTPQKKEIIAAFYRHQDDRQKARDFYEEPFAMSHFSEKEGGAGRGTQPEILRRGPFVGFTNTVDPSRLQRSPFFKF